VVEYFCQLHSSACIAKLYRRKREMDERAKLQFAAFCHGHTLAWDRFKKVALVSSNWDDDAYCLIDAHFSEEAQAVLRIYRLGALTATHEMRAAGLY
jgi:hypothetical protein